MYFGPIDFYIDRKQLSTVLVKSSQIRYRLDARHLILTNIDSKSTDSRSIRI